MSDFDISDKELKSLLKAEGPDKPSVDFNQLVMDKIKKAEKRKAQPVTAPRWLLILMGLLFIAPSLYFVFSGQSILTDSQQYQFHLPSFLQGANSKYLLIGAIAVLAIGITLLIDGLFRKQSAKDRVKKG